ncbi:MAG: hypothetical protein HY077_09325 [Elusimicrobia bacterium]|nr:hypothetical protein [Elusimicrobiota bacterium]
MPHACKPFGSPSNRIWFLGHDPRLRKNDAEASTCFFLDLLNKPKQVGEGSKRGLAQSVMRYVSALSGRHVSRTEIFVTNLCNEFLDRPSIDEVVLIPDRVAEIGVRRLARYLLKAKQPPEIIISSSQQVLYHLARTKFLKPHQLLIDFEAASTPNPRLAAKGAYQPSRTAAFLQVCGLIFEHQGIPVIPVLHVASHRFMRHGHKYRHPMERAKVSIQNVLCAARD